jgi:dolichol-phosphate mannosyltransferase
MPELSVILPTFNESGNVGPMIQRLMDVLANVDHEIIVVDDDSDDGTAALVRSIAQRFARVRLIHRINRRGLASACVEGIMASTAPYIAVMDADLQHDEQILPEMLNLIRRGDVDVVIASRRMTGASMGEFAPARVALSETGRRLGNLIAKVSVSDLMSGYFLVTRTYADQAVRSMSCKGFKVLLDLLASGPRSARVIEVPYTFRSRLSGESKLDVLVGLEYLHLLLDKTIGRYLPVTYVLFAMVGSVGVLFHLLMVAQLIRRLGLQLVTAQALSSLVVIALNFFLNNELTFRDTRLRGSELFKGWLIFSAACLVGLLANVQIAGYLRSFGVPWYAASAIGIVFGSVWNYSVSRTVVWQRRRRQVKVRVQAITQEYYVAPR